MMKVLLLDNYDSFTYNLAHYLEKLDCEVVVLRNDDPALQSVDWNAFDGLVLSPGPGLPEESGELMRIIADQFGRMPILGVCLGMQALALHSGGELYNRQGVMHGRSVTIKAKRPGQLLRGIDDLTVGLYHSWAVVADRLPKDWGITAVALQDEAPMVMEHESGKAFGVQFHPESILTTQGYEMLSNWVSLLSKSA